VSLEEGLKQADFVSLHTPLTPATKHLINAENLKLLKATAVLVNTARGPVVDEQALAAALKAGRLFAAGLDVYEDEPRVSKELLELENVALTPHIGSGARRYREMMTQIVGANVSAVLFGGKPVSVVTG
jgi:phosphoglycerate dehydrogenase-like enzyme